MSILSINHPALIHVNKYATNGLYPDASFYAQAVGALNHTLAYRRKVVYRKVWPLGLAGGSSGVVGRWYCKTGHAAARLAVLVVLGFDDRNLAVDPYITVAITKVGGSTTTRAFHGGATSSPAVDAPEEMMPQIDWVDVDPASAYSGEVEFFDNVRVISITVFEESNANVDESTDFFSEWEPGAGSPIYDNRQQQLLAGIGGIVRINRGLRWDWHMDDGSGRGRTSATAICLIDNTSATPPTNATPGVSFVTNYRNTVSATTVPITMAVYGSIGAGSGAVYLRDTAGNNAASVTVNGTNAWFTATGALTVGTGQRYSLYYASDGANFMTIRAVSIFEDQ